MTDIAPADEHRSDGPDQYWARPVVPSVAARTGVLVLAGSSGRLDTARADLLAGLGVTALALRWFGGAGQPEHPVAVPVETFTRALDEVARECRRLVVWGLSYGAEAALLTASLDPRVEAVIALSPSDVAWEGYRSTVGDPPRSKWTWQGAEVPFVPFDTTWQPTTDPPAFREGYEHSRQVADPETVRAATLAVERIRGEVLLVAGGDDRVWPSAAAANSIEARRTEHGLPTRVIHTSAAGHFVTFPSEPAVAVERPHQVGGDPRSDAELGALAWPSVRRILGVPDLAP